MNIAGYGLGKVEDTVGYGFKKAWGVFEDYAPSAAQTVGEAATWAGGHIGEAAGYLGEKIPDGVKDKYNGFLDSSTEEERTLMAWLSGPGAGKAASLGIEGTAKLAKGFSKLEDVAPDGLNKAHLDNKVDSSAKQPDYGFEKGGYKTRPYVDEPELNVAENVVGHEAHKTELRAAMQEPHVSDKNLKKIMGTLYKEGADAGSGSTAAALRHELATGERVGGRFHTQKVNENMKNLEKWIMSNPTASSADRAAAENVLKDMKNALNGGN